MSDQTTKLTQPRGGRMKFTIIALALSFLLLVAAFIYSSWRASSERDANLPSPAMETIVLALRAFHQQTGRFPRDFRELDERIWRGARSAQISSDGKTLTASVSNYFYTLHTINPSDSARATEPVKAGIWAAPTGARAQEAATYFWYVTPTQIESWMGPALTRENVGAVRGVPSEQQLALLAMTRQAANGGSLTSPRRSGIFSLFPF